MGTAAACAPSASESAIKTRHPLAAASADSSAPTLPKTEVVSTDSAPEAVWQEVEIKLDLAKAYLEMTDREGARELLKEAMAEGDAAQQQRAKTMLDSLA
jgi:pilus assembly protein FimV